MAKATRLRLVCSDGRSLTAAEDRSPMAPSGAGAQWMLSASLVYWAAALQFWQRVLSPGVPEDPREEKRSA